MRTFGILFCGALFCAAGIAAQGQSVKSTEPSAGSKEDLSVLAGKMLDQTNNARKAIKDQNKTEALHDVEQAQTELRNIQARANGATTIPVYQEFVSVSILNPVQAEHEARRRANHEAVVHQVAGDYTNVAVNTTVAQKSLEAAKQALNASNFKLADEALADVQEGVSIEEVEANMPLARARENLVLARAAAEKSHFGEAHAALASASRALSSYINQGGQHADQARSLKQQIDSYDQNLQRNHTNVVAKINQWWNTTSDWTPYEVGHNKLTAGG